MSPSDGDVGLEKGGRMWEGREREREREREKGVGMGNARIYGILGEEYPIDLMWLYSVGRFIYFERRSLKNLATKM